MLWNKFAMHLTVIFLIIAAPLEISGTKDYDDVDEYWLAEGDFCGLDYGEECCISSANCKPVSGGGTARGYPKFCRSSGNTRVYCCMRNENSGYESGENYYPNKGQYGGKYPPPAFGYFSFNYRPGFGHAPQEPPAGPPGYPSFPQPGGSNQNFPGTENTNQGGGNDQFPGYNPGIGAMPSRPPQRPPQSPPKFPPFIHSGGSNNDAMGNTMSTSPPITSPPITSNPVSNSPPPQSPQPQGQPQNMNVDVNFNQQGGIDPNSIQEVLGATNPDASGSINIQMPYFKPSFQNTTYLRKCGEYFRQVQLLKGPHTPVIGGRDARPREFPHLALLGYGSANDIQWLCGGSLISEQFVLTAAHCIASRLGRVQYVRLGELDLNSTTEPSDPIDLTVQERIVHPLYRPFAAYHDIALLRLNASVTFNIYRRPICLATTYQLDMRRLIVAGWGLTEVGGAFPSVLQRTTLQFVPTERCQRIYGTNRSLRQGILDQVHVCADGGSERRDTCNGDSGGPLQYTNYEYNETGLLGFAEVAGITSFGGNGCGLTAGVYTRVLPYVQWISRIVWPNE